MASSAELGFNHNIHSSQERMDEDVETLNAGLGTVDKRLAPAAGDVELNEDGSANVYDDAEPEEPRESSFDENLAEYLEDGELLTIGNDLWDAIDRDREARKDRDQQYADGLASTGMGRDGSGAAFDGSSGVMHPVIAEGCVDFAARAIKEIFPPQGPCKTHIIGKASDEKLDRAERKRQYMNWQLTTQIKEFRGELESMLSQVPLGGEQYIKVYRDSVKKRIRTEFVSIDHVFRPMTSSSLMASHRVTHLLRLTKNEFEARVSNGTYADADYGSAPSSLETKSESEQQNDSIEGLDDSQLYDDDGLRDVYESQVDYALDADLDPIAAGEVMPYVITIDGPSKRVMAISRNWEEGDDSHEKLVSLVAFPFIPWRGTALGLPHLIGNLADAATGALRALLDSAHINNSPTAIRLKGSGMSGSSTVVEPGEIAEIDAPPGSKDIREVVMPMPYNPPSNVLYQLLGFCVDAAKGLVGTSLENVSENNGQMPVGTALALIEQGSITYSAIHARLHAAVAQVLAVIHRLNKMYLSDREVVEDLGALVISRKDFEGPLDIIPVSDPNIFSEAQRYAQLQAVLQLADKWPDLYKRDTLNMRALKLLNWPDPEGVLAAPPPAERVDQPYMENSIAAQGNAIKAYSGQDHILHLRVHLQFVTSPLFGANPLVGKMAVPPILMHCAQHLILLYEDHMKAALGATQDMTTQMPGMALDENHATALAMQMMAKDLEPLMPLLQQAQQLAQQYQPQPPQDPAIVVGMAEVKRKTDDDAARLKFDTDKAQAAAAQDQKDSATKNQFQQQALALERQQAQMAAQQEQIAAQQAAHQKMISDALERQSEENKQAMDRALQVLLAEIKAGGLVNQTLVAESIRASGVGSGNEVTNSGA